MDYSYTSFECDFWDYDMISEERLNAMAEAMAEAEEQAEHEAWLRAEAKEEYYSMIHDGFED